MLQSMDLRSLERTGLLVVMVGMVLLVHRAIHHGDVVVHGDSIARAHRVLDLSLLRSCKACTQFLDLCACHVGGTDVG